MARKTFISPTFTKPRGQLLVFTLKEEYFFFCTHELKKVWPKQITIDTLKEIKENGGYCSVIAAFICYTS